MSSKNGKASSNGTTAVLDKPAAPPAVEAPSEVVNLLPLDIKEIVLHINGITPLIMHRWTDKAKDMMRQKQQKKATAGRATRNPAQECEESTYFLSKSPVRYGFPALGLKKCLVEGAMSIPGQKKAVIRRSFHVIEDGRNPVDGPLVEIIAHEPPVMREDMVRVGMGTADLRYRPYFNAWSIDLRIRYDRTQISAEQITNLVNKAGFSTGIGDWRVEKDGESGQFEVVGVEALG